MSLVREALRMSVVRALRGRTWAGERVYDSQHGSVDDIADNEPTPVILVFTDDSEREGKLTAFDLLSPRSVTVFIEVLMTQRMVMPMIDPESGEPIIDPSTGRPKPARDEEGNLVFDVFPVNTDAGLEFGIGVMQRQIVLALNDPENDWADVAKRFAPTLAGIKDQRGVSDRGDGVRFAGRQLELTVQLIGEPRPGMEISGAWGLFLMKMDEQPEPDRQVASVFRELIEGKADQWDDLAKVRAVFGYTSETADALNLSPLVADADPVSEIALVDADS